MLITTVLWGGGFLVVFLVGVDALRRRFAGDVPALTRHHLVWVIVGQTIIIGSIFLMPAIVLIRDLLQ